MTKLPAVTALLFAVLSTASQAFGGFVTLVPPSPGPVTLGLGETLAVTVLYDQTPDIDPVIGFDAGAFSSVPSVLEITGVSIAPPFTVPGGANGNFAGIDLSGLTGNFTLGTVTLTGIALGDAVFTLDFESPGFGVVTDGEFPPLVASRSLLVNVVPEPSTLFLTLIGSGVIALLRRRRHEVLTKV